jgi:hypothetical protein
MWKAYLEDTLDTPVAFVNGREGGKVAAPLPAAGRCVSGSLRHAHSCRLRTAIGSSLMCSHGHARLDKPISTCSQRHPAAAAVGVPPVLRTYHGFASDEAAVKFSDDLFGLYRHGRSDVENKCGEPGRFL